MVIHCIDRQYDEWNFFDPLRTLCGKQFPSQNGYGNTYPQYDFPPAFVDGRHYGEGQRRCKTCESHPILPLLALGSLDDG